MKKWVKVLLIVIALIVIVILGVGLYLYWPYLQSEPNAILNVEKGNVYVDSGKGFVNAVNGMSLKEGWIVKTENESEAEIVFFGGAEARMEGDSEIGIEGIDVKAKTAYLAQRTGESYYNILDGSGIVLIIETADGTVMNEGCSFSVSVPRVVTSGNIVDPMVRTQVGVTGGFAAISTGLRLNSDRTTAPSSQIRVIPAVEIGRIVTNIRNDATRTNIQTGTTGIIANREVTTTPLVITPMITKNIIKDNDFTIKKREDLKNKYARNIRLGKQAYKMITGNELTDSMLNSYIDGVLKKEINVGKMINDRVIPKQYSYLIPSELNPTFYVPFGVMEQRICGNTLLEKGEMCDLPGEDLCKGLDAESEKKAKDSKDGTRIIFTCNPKTCQCDKTVNTKEGTPSYLLYPIPKDVVKDNSPCFEGQEKSEIKTSEEKKALYGVDSIKVVDLKGYRGLKKSEQKEIIENTEVALNIIKALEVANLVYEAAGAHKWVEVIKGAIDGGHIGATKGMEDNIMHQLDEWQKKGTLSGLPLEIDVEWENKWWQELTKVKKTKIYYQCTNKQWKFWFKVDFDDEFKKGACHNLGGKGTNTFKPSLDDRMDERERDQCTAGTCPRVWAAAISNAIADTMNKIKAQVVGKCIDG